MGAHHVRVFHVCKALVLQCRALRRQLRQQVDTARPHSRRRQEGPGHPRVRERTRSLGVHRPQHTLGCMGRQAWPKGLQFLAGQSSQGECAVHGVEGQMKITQYRMPSSHRQRETPLKRETN